MTVIVTVAEAFDVITLLELENECFSVPYTQEMLNAMLANPLAVVLKAILNGELIGYIALERAFDDAELVKIAVKKANRRNGAGRLLLESAVEKLLNNDVKKLFLEVDETNESALNLYKSFGFSIISIRKKYYGDRAAVIMCKNL